MEIHFGLHINKMIKINRLTTLNFKIDSSPFQTSTVKRFVDRIFIKSCLCIHRSPGFFHLEGAFPLVLEPTPDWIRQKSRVE